MINNGDADKPNGPDILDGLPGVDGGNIDSIVETTQRSWLEKIGASLKAIVVGLILVIAAGALMFWNEGRSARTAAALSEGADAVVSVTLDRVDPAHNGRLVHLAGDTNAGALIRESDFGFEVRALSLTRKVEMYQWKEERQSETQKKLGGGEETVTRYSYSKEWSDRWVDSSRFRNAADHRNPAMPLAHRDWYATDARLGAFKLGDEVLRGLSAHQTFDAPDSSLAQARARLGARARMLGGAVYSGDDPNNPSVGDVRVSWKVLPPGPVSVVAQQAPSGLTAWKASNGNDVLLTETGIVAPAVMFRHGEEENNLIAWLLRIVGIVLMFVGFRLILSLLEALGDVVPFIGNLLGAGASMVALLLTLVVAPLIISLAWIFYRPLVALSALIIGAGLVYLWRMLMRRRAPATAVHSQH